MRYVRFVLGALSLTAGIIGVFLPLLPTVPLLLLAAFFFGKSSKRAYVWLLSHPTLGPEIINWRENGAISRRSKYLAAASMVAVVCLSLLFRVTIIIVIFQMVILGLVSVFIWSRPNS